MLGELNRFIYLFTGGLLNDSVSRSGYVASITGLIDDHVLWRAMV
jgi:hypothetical protein